MSTIIPYTHSQTAVSNQFTTNPPSNPANPLSTPDVLGRSSSQTIKLASMSRSRSNSIVSRRQSSRAGFRQAEFLEGQGGQQVFANHGEFDFGDLDYFGSLDDFGFDPTAVSHMDAFLDAFPDSLRADSFKCVSDSQYMSSGIQAHQQDYYDPTVVLQPQQSYNPNLVFPTDIDPALLAEQAPYKSLPHAQPQYAQSVDPNLFATPGLTAVPGAADIMPFDPQLGIPAMQLPYDDYPDPTVLQQQQPYFARPDFRQQFQQFPVQQAVHGDVALPQNVSKRRRSDAGSDSDTPHNTRIRIAKLSQQESDDEFDIVQSVKPTGVRKGKVVRRESRESGISNNSSLGKPNQNVIKRTGQLPQKCEEKSWVRINTATKGETTRTDRINRESKERPKYKYHPLPHGDWQTLNGKYSFEYDTRFDIDVFKSAHMSPRQLTAYILKFPSNHLRLWLQVAPADSVRRYASDEHYRCMFSHCPKRVHGDHGTINVGHYRIAFDEKYKTTGLSNPNKEVDPFDCVGFVHLYCLERFCDFETMCRERDVRIDDRVHLPRETSHAKWSMSGRPEAGLAQFFIKACVKDKLRTTEQFKDYPVHQSSSEPKPYDGTLCKALTETHLANRTRSQIRQFVNRQLTPEALIVHRGDMEVAMTKKRIEETSAYKKWKSRKDGSEFNFDAHYEAFHPVISQRIQDALALRKQFIDEDATGFARKKGKAKAAPRGTKRKVIAIVEDSDSEPDFSNNRGANSLLEDLEDYHHPGADAESPHGTRSSLRKRPRINYADEDNHVFVPQPALPSSSSPAAPQVQDPLGDTYVAQGYQPAQQHRQPSWSEQFARMGGTLNLDDFPTTGLPTNEEMAEFLKGFQERRRSTAEALQRRKSSTLSHGPLHAGIMKPSQRSPSLHSPRKSSGGRQASFALQPVSESKEFEINDPPNQVASTATRRSARLASRSS